MQYHASLLTADGEYHCPVGSIWLFFNFKSAPRHTNNWCVLVAGGILSVLVSSDTVEIPEMVRIHKMKFE